MKKTEYITNSPLETKQIAMEFSKTLHGGEVIFAYGPLGAGKTAFVQALGKELGVKGIINSPTFNLIKVYQGTSLTLYHVDCYRLENADDERKGLGLDEVFGDSSIVTYVEWPMYLSEELLNYHPRITLTLSYLDDEKRKLVIEDERQ